MDIAVSLISPYLGFVLQFIFIGMLVPCRISKPRLAVYLSPTLLSAVPKFIWGAGSMPAVFATLIVVSATSVLYPALLFPKGKWKAVAYALFFFVIALFSDCITLILFQNVFKVDTTMLSLRELIAYVAMTWSIFSLLSLFFVSAMRSISMRRFSVFYLLFPVFPLSQQILIVCSVYQLQNVFFAIGIVLGIAADIGLLWYTIAHEKKMELENRVREFGYVIEAERLHCEELERRQKQLSHIRHDFNNQLAAIGHLIRQGEAADAERMIHEISDDIRSTGRNLYCSIPVVNAVLTEKDNVCQEAGIRLETELAFPEEVVIEPVYLCSIFSNLLDNAIRGVKTSGASERKIRLSVRVHGEHLFIKTSNPAQKTPQKPPRGHGQGLHILEQISAQHGGSFQSSYADGTFTAIVCLPCDKKA